MSISESTSYIPTKESTPESFGMLLGSIVSPTIIAIFPYRIAGHYNAKGYAEVARQL